MKIYMSDLIKGLTYVTALLLTPSLQGQILNTAYDLSETFEEYRIVRNNSTELLEKVRQETGFVNVNIDFGYDKKELELHLSDLFSENYIVNSSDGEINTQRPIPLKGIVRNDNQSFSRITLNHGFIYGFVEQNGERLYIQPLSDFARNVSDELYVAYYNNDVKENPTKHLCASNKAQSKSKYLIPTNNIQLSSVGDCFEVEIALAADWLMHQDHGGVVGTENQITAVLNDVQTNYDDEFADEIKFVISEFWISNCSTCDPWTAGTNAGNILSSFRTWGEAGGFSNPYDVATLWTDRNLNGGTVGVAWFNAICTSFGYNVCEDFTSTSWALRVLWAHELGHNFNASHDGSGSPTIMAPSVNNTSTWSAASINSIQNHYNSRTCLDFCALAPPVADFNYDQNGFCIPITVDFVDVSTNNPVSWLWSFPGGNPTSSIDQNPTGIFYDTPGTYDVTLEATNSVGSNQITKTSIVVVEGPPIPSFDYTITDNNAIFTNTTLNGDSYYWNFGDGFDSTDEHPVHVYVDDGVYTVLLEATNICGTNTTVETIVIATPPVADFVGGPTSGCVVHTVTFTDLSSNNTTSWDWSFPGGSPATSSDQNPIITYNTPGLYDVTLVAINPQGTSTFMETDFVEVFAQPIPQFTYTQNGSEFIFVNSSQNSTSYSWDFGDGNSSTDVHPIHTYMTEGTFTVELMADNNNCPPETTSVTVSVILLPSAQFQVIGDTEGCASFEVEFQDLSGNNPTSWDWSFPGGSPSSSSSSSEQNPTVNYITPGVYDVTLIVSNINGMDTVELENYITVNTDPTAMASYVQNGLEITFTDMSTGADTYTWDFGDGNGSSEASPIYAYNQEGIHDVSLTVENECGSSTYEVTLNLYTIPSADASADVTDGCAPMEVQYSSLASDNTTSWEWSFPGGNPATSTDENPLVTYNTVGSYNVTLEVSNPGGSDMITFTDLITISDVPLSSFNHQSNLLEVDFINTSSDTDSFEWDFGDGMMSSDPDPTHVYSVIGDYLVTLIATNVCGDDTTKLTVTVTDLPVANFQSDIMSGCPSFEVGFDNLSSASSTTFSWTFEGGDPMTSSVENPVITYDTPGSYDVELVAGNGTQEDIILLTDFIVVMGQPTAGFDFSYNGNEIVFDNMSSQSNDYAWIFGDGETSSDMNPTHIYVNNGNYTVQLIASNQCELDTIEQAISIEVYPRADFLTSISNGCPGFEVDFTDNSEIAESWNWTFEGGDPLTSNEQNPMVTYYIPGDYSVSLIVTNPFGDSEKIVDDEIHVDSPPVSDFAYSVNAATLSFDNLSSNATSFNWDFGDGEMSMEENPSHMYSESETYSVTLEVDGTCGTDAYSIEIDVEVLRPVINIIYSTDEACAPFTINFTDGSTNNPTQWNWVFEGGDPATSTDQNPSVVFNNPGVFDVSLEASNDFGTSTLLLEDIITIFTHPIANFDFSMVGGEVTFDNMSQYGDTYIWDFGDGEISNDENPIHSYTMSGDYTVTLEVSNMCGEHTFTQEVNVIVSSIDDLPLSVKSLEIFPNPGDGSFYLKLDAQASKFLKLSIYDILGRKMDVQIIDFDNGRLKILVDMIHMDSGTYLISIETDQFHIVRKWVKR